MIASFARIITNCHRSTDAYQTRQILLITVHAVLVLRRYITPCGLDIVGGD